MAKAKKPDAVENIIEEVNKDQTVEEEAKVNTYDTPKEKYSWLFGILAFFLFPVGIILHYVFRDTHKGWATASSKCAGWGICFYIVSAFVSLVVLFVLVYANGCSPFLN